MFKPGLIAGLFIAAGLRIASASPEFEAANASYDAGRFEQARDQYLGLVAKGQFTPNLFYNLGNAEFRLNNPGAATLHYERALALDAAHAEAVANLAFVREKTGARVEQRTWWEAALAHVPGDMHAVLAAVCAWVVMFCITAALFGKIARGTAWVASILAIAIGAAAVLGTRVADREQTLAVIITRAEARMAPAENSALADTLPPGSRVHVLADRGPWFYCRLPSRQTAWLSSAALERVALSGS